MVTWSANLEQNVSKPNSWGIIFSFIRLDVFCELRFERYNKHTTREELEILSHIVTKAGNRKRGLIVPQYKREFESGVEKGVDIED